MRITILGGGNMGAAIADALLQKQILPAQNLTLTDLNLTKLQKFAEQGVQVASDNLAAVQSADIILIAVKPQVMAEVLNPLSSKISAQTLVISIAAGVKLAALQDLLNHQPVVRVMPNLPATLGVGMSGWLADSTVTPAQKEKVKKILNACGAEIEVENEDQIDAVTALSGCGPAYVFLFLQSLINGAVKLGLTQLQAQKAALQTVLGGVKLAQKSTQDLQTLINAVASKGGATEKALQKFTELNFQTIIEEAMQAAYQRAQELGGK